MAEKQAAAPGPSHNSPNKSSKAPFRVPESYSRCLLHEMDKISNLLCDIRLASITPAIERELYEPKTDVKTEANPLDLTVSSKMACSVCNADFTARTEQIQHYKLDWHRFNLKQKLLGYSAVTEETFDDMTGEISSLSGTDSGSEDEGDTTNTSSSEVTSSPSNKGKPSGVPPYLRRRRHQRKRSPSFTSTDTDYESDEKKTETVPRFNPKLYFRNREGEIIALYRCIVHGKLDAPSSEAELLAAVQDLPFQTMWAVILVGGGHFAAAIFNGPNVIEHKTFHRYTVRAKQGGAQVTRDGHQGGHAPKSGGASLRRHNEAALIRDIQELLNTWSDHLKKCTRIFYRAPSFNRVALFGSKIPPFKKTDPRLRCIPFPTRRATFSEVQRVQKLLATVECFGKESLLGGVIPQSPKVHLGTKKPSKNLSQTLDSLTAMDLSCLKVSEQNSLVTKPTNVKLETNFEEPMVISDMDSEPGEVFEFVCEEMQTSSMKESEWTKKPRKMKHKRSKMKDMSWKRQSDPHNEMQNDTKHHVRDILYTSCKSGDLEKLRCTLQLLQSESTVQENPVREDEEAGAQCVQLKSDEQNLENASLPNTDARPETVSKSSLCVNNQPDANCEKFLHSPKMRRNRGIGTSLTDEDLVDKIQSPPSLLTDQFPTMSQESDGDDETSASVQDPKPGTSSAVQKKHHKLKIPSRSTSRNREDIKTPEISMEMINEPVGDSGATLLHIAAREGHREVVTLLLEHGANPAIKDKQGVSPYLASLNKETRNEFRNFMACNPEKYDYAKAQIPSPFTPEQLAQQLEKKKARKKAKKEKLKERKQCEAQQKADEEERKRFLSLSDREKRALAAEKRFTQQLAQSGKSKVLSRCFQCGQDITGKVPFEYNDCCFCSTKCVRDHRKMHETSRS